MAEREITGRHVFIGFTVAFGVIVSVNLVMAYSALATFPGLEANNGYIASQTFDERREAQEALGWSVRADHADGMMVMRITDADGAPVEARDVEVLVGRSTTVAHDQSPDLQFNGGAYVARLDLAGGKWVVHLSATAPDGTPFRQRFNLHVKR
jgi:nitrogen fixation protein FixH